MHLRTPIFAIAALVLMPATLSAQENSDNGLVEGDTNVIIVKGNRLKESGDALAACIARGCPPEEDMRLTLAHAENQFLEGIYKDGQKTLRASLDRNRKYGDKLPVPVSGLYRASARFAENLGEPRDFKLATLDMRDTLKDGLGKDDWRVLVAQTEVGDSRAKLGFPDEARRIYRDVEERALGLQQWRVASFARMRQALLWRAEWEDNKKVDYTYDNMMEILTELRDNPLPGGEEFVLIAEVLQSRIDRSLGKEDSTEALVQAYAERGGANRPILLYSDPFRTTYRNISSIGSESEPPGATTTSALSALSLNNPRWVDIGFLIKPDGMVGEVEVLRSEGGAEWSKAVMKNILTRRYAPIAGGDASPGFYMIERYSVTSRFTDQTTGTRLRKREPSVRVERLDITPEDFQRPSLDSQADS